jgi:hypothetical protein
MIVLRRFFTPIVATGFKFLPYSQYLALSIGTRADAAKDFDLTRFESL